MLISCYTLLACCIFIILQNICLCELSLCLNLDLWKPVISGQTANSYFYTDCSAAEKHISRLIELQIMVDISVCILLANHSLLS